MPKTFHLIIHPKKQDPVTLSFTVESKSFKNVAIPDMSRKSTLDAVLFDKLKVYWSIQLSLGVFPTHQDQLFTLKYLKKHSPAYKMYNLINADLASVLNSELKLNDVFRMMQDHNIYTKALSQEGEDLLIKSLKKQLKNREMKILDSKSEFESYNTFYLQIPPAINPIESYFAKMGVTLEDNFNFPEYYLDRNFKLNYSEPLLHIRQCEDIHCSYHPQTSPFVQSVNENLEKQLLRFMTQGHKDKDELVFYGGFASNLLLRDTRIVNKLIKAGYKKFEFLFLDKIYDPLVKQVSEEYGNLNMEDDINVRMQHNAFMEFGNWIVTQLENEEASISIHIFSDLAEVEHFFNQYSQKLSLLVGQDYFTMHGCWDAEYATPEAHADFMKLVKRGLSSKGCFFELVKNDRKQEMYLHTGFSFDGEYNPWFTNIHDTFKKNTKVFPFTSLGFFTECDDKPSNCSKGIEVLEYDAQQNLISKR